MICPKCSKQIEDGAKFCTACGEVLTTGARKLYIDAKGLTLFNYKFDVKDENGNLVYRAGTVTESLITYNARISNPDGSEALAIHQQKKLTLAAMNFNLVLPDGTVLTEAKQVVHMFRSEYQFPALGFTMGGDFLSLRFTFKKDGKDIAKVNKKVLAWGDCYELSFEDPSLELPLLGAIMVAQLAIAAARNKQRRRR